MDDNRSVSQRGREDVTATSATTRPENKAEKKKIHKMEWTGIVGLLAIIGAIVVLYWAIKWLIMWPVWVLYFVGVGFYAIRIHEAFKTGDYKYAWSRIWVLVAIGAILLLLAIIF